MTFFLKQPEFEQDKVVSAANTHEKGDFTSLCKSLGIPLTNEILNDAMIYCRYKKPQQPSTVNNFNRNNNCNTNNNNFNNYIWHSFTR